jgi:hypothetical protein
MIKKAVILVVAVAVLVALLWYTKGSSRSSTKPKYVVSQSLRDQVSAFKIIDKQDTALIEDKEGKWVTAGDDFPADTSKVRKVLDAVFKLEDNEVVSRNPERFKEYGLDSSSVKTVRIYGNDGKELYAARIGKTSSADYASTYWSKEDGKTVYRTSGNFSHDIDGDIMEWKEKKLYDFEKKDIQKMEVFWRDSAGTPTTFTVQAKGDDNWEIVSPKFGNVKKSPVEAMLNRFKQLRIDKFPEEEDKPKMDESPSLEINVTLTDGSTHRLVAQKGEDHFYMQHPERENIIKLSKWRLEVFEKALDEVFEPIKDTASADTTIDTAKTL